MSLKTSLTSIFLCITPLGALAQDQAAIPTDPAQSSQKQIHLVFNFLSTRHAHNRAIQELDYNMAFLMAYLEREENHKSPNNFTSSDFMERFYTPYRDALSNLRDVNQLKWQRIRDTEYPLDYCTSMDAYFLFANTYKELAPYVVNQYTVTNELAGVVNAVYASLEKFRNSIGDFKALHRENSLEWGCFTRRI